MTPRLPRALRRRAGSALRRLDRATRPVRRRVWSSVERLEPPVRLLHPSLSSPQQPVGVVCVYRQRNAATVARLLASAPAGTRVALWALDAAAPALAERTVGTGPGGRTALLNRLSAALDLPDDGWLVMTDDDVVLQRGTLSDLVALAGDLGFDVCQPAHSHRSTHFWRINEHRFLTWARATRFVETGPLIVFSGRARRVCLPLPEAFAMGIGIEAVWGREPSLRLGIVESMTMLHTGVMGAAYDGGSEWRASEPLVAQLLRPVGLEKLEDLHVQQGRWWWLQRRPRWALAPATGAVTGATGGGVDEPASSRR